MSNQASNQIDKIKRAKELLKDGDLKTSLINKLELLKKNKTIQK